MSTDPTSSDFDPLKALYSDSTDEKKSTIKVYDNVATFEAKLKRQSLKSNDEEKVKKDPVSRKSKSFSQNKKLLEEADKRDLSKLKEMMETRKKLDAQKYEGKSEKEDFIHKKLKTQKNIFTSMEVLKHGPMKMLYKLVTKRQRCHVYVRHFCGLRGVLVGFIVAFDRFMNLTMVDIDEIFCIAPRGKVKYHQKPLSVTQLRQAVQVQGNKKGVHPDTRGQQRSTAQTISSKEESPSRNSSQKEIIRLKGKQARLDTFSGGFPQLYQRHLQQIYVRGDSVVLISNDI